MRLEKGEIAVIDGLEMGKRESLEREVRERFELLTG